MSILPEMILQQTLIRGIRLFREDEKLAGMLFRNVDQKELQAIIDFLRNDSIEICNNYPDQDLKIPAIVILLKNEQESQPFLGELQQDTQSLRASGYPFPTDELQGDQTVVGAGSAGPTAAQYPMLTAPTRATGGTSTSILAPASLTNLIDPFEDESWVVIMEGAGAGDRRLIDSITPPIGPDDGVTIDIDPSTPFSAIPDVTSVFKIVGPAPLNVTGEPAKLYKSSDNIERIGTIFKATYQLDIYGPNQEATIYLYNIVKAIFFSCNGLLIKQGFLTFMRLSGTDLMPVPDFYPGLVYRRSLSMEFQYAFDVFRAVTEPIAKHIQLALSVHSPNTQNVADSEREITSVTFDL